MHLKYIYKNLQNPAVNRLVRRFGSGTKVTLIYGNQSRKKMLLKHWFHGSLRLVRLIVARHGIHVQDRWGSQPLHKITYHVESVHLLVACGCQLNARTKRIACGFPLNCASDVASVRALLSWGADPNAAHGGEISVFEYLCDKIPHATDLIRPLLEAGAHVEGNTTMRSNGPLLYAVVYGDKWIQLIKLLLEFGADPRRCNLDGESPLSLAKKLPYVPKEVVDLLEQ